MPQSATRRRKQLKISMTPLIDVVFILLVFFMLASSFHDWRAIQLNSAGKTGEPSTMEGSMLVELTADGPRLSGELMNLETLKEKLAARIAIKSDQRVLVRPGDGVDMQQMVTLLDVLAAAGASEISLMPGR